MLSGVGVASVQPFEDALQFWTGVSKAQRKKVNFFSKNNLIWFKMMGESCVCLGSKEIRVFGSFRPFFKIFEIFEKF